MTLSEAREGQWLIVTATGSAELTLQALRFGIEAGAHVYVRKKIAGGPVIIARNQLEIAVGHQIALSIQVAPGSEGQV